MDPRSPWALRAGHPRWRDARLWIGILIVVVSVLVGARLLAAADRTVEVWQVTDDHLVGTPIDSASVAAVRVHFADDGIESRYLSAEQALPDAAVLARDVSAGELLASDALIVGPAAAQRQLPLLVPANGFPSNLQVGDQVEVWTTGQAGETAGPTSRALGPVTVVALSSGDFATATTERTVVVAIPPDQDVRDLLDSLAGRSVVLLRVGG